MQEGHIYFHSVCFDGIISAVLTWDFLESHDGWHDLSLHAVNYDKHTGWLSSALQEPAAVVDFLYHPQSSFWADHHVTSFVDDAVRQDYERRKTPYLVYDERADSCAGLLWNHLARVFSHRSSRYAELIGWAEKIDAARYESVSEAIFAPSPALKINAGLSLGNADGYSEGLVRAFREHTLDEVAKLPDVEARFEQSLSLTKVGLNRFGQASHVENDGIVVYDVDVRGALVNRYAPFHFFPEARYSVGVSRAEHGAKITAMRNPWREFESVPLGPICEKFGGGGHQRVGSIIVRPEGLEAASIMHRLISEIRRQERIIEQKRIAEIRREGRNTEQKQTA